MILECCNTFLHYATKPCAAIVLVFPKRVNRLHMEIVELLSTMKIDYWQSYEVGHQVTVSNIARISCFFMFLPRFNSYGNGKNRVTSIVSNVIRNSVPVRLLFITRTVDTLLQVERT
ncbi:MAG: hypothetical protein FD122_3851, partial [Stygiobacter sp.]